MIQEHKQLLLSIARQSIQHGLEKQKPLPINISQYPHPLTESRATFVTLEINEGLRGCIGSLEAHRPLIVDIAQNAFAAAFEDPRFPPITHEELKKTEISLSLLTPPMKLEIQNEESLLSQLQPFQDGLILEEGFRRATFLPAVWEDLPDPIEFLNHLKMKAGWPINYWSSRIKAYRYRAEKISESTDLEKSK